MSTTEWENEPFPSIFMDHFQRTGHFPYESALPIFAPSLQIICFQAAYGLCHETNQGSFHAITTMVKKKRELFPELELAFRSSFMLPFTRIPIHKMKLGVGILTYFPFAEWIFIFKHFPRE